MWLSALYPVNAMRNRALARARTEAVLLLDVDFWPSAELSELVQKPAKYASLVEELRKGTAVVLPAYETGDSGDIGVEVAREAVLGECVQRRADGAGRAALQRSWRGVGWAGRVQATAAPTTRPGPALPPACGLTLPARPLGRPTPPPLSTAGAEGKDAAVRMFKDGRIKAFHTDRYAAGHGATNYKHWMTAARPYPIQCVPPPAAAAALQLCC